MAELTVLLVSLVLCGVGAVILLLWRQQRLAFSRSRHELNLALRNNEELYRSILHASIHGFWLMDMQRRLLEVNETYCRMSGYSKQELLSMHYTDLEALETAEDTGTRIKNVIVQGEDRFESRHRRKDGSSFDVEVSVQYLYVKGGQLVFFLQDISDRKMAEKAMKESEARLDFALQNSRIGAWEMSLLDHTTNRTLIHDRIYGYETLLPRWTYEMFLEHVLPEDRPEVDRIFCEAAASQTSWNFEFRIRRADGEVRWIYAAGDHLRNSEGKSDRVSGIVQDITQRKMAEAELEQEKTFTEKLLNLEHDTFFLFEPATGKPIKWNKRFAEVSGYHNEEIAGMKAPDNFYDSDSLKKTKKSHDRIFAGGQAVTELSLVTKQGMHIPFEYAVTRVETPDGRTLLLLIGRDITERKRSQAKLEQQATTDELTGATNRHRFLELANTETKRAIRLKRPLTIAFIDIDFFKHINDTYGHATGDQALLAVTQVFQKNIREIDVFARFGGDEFVLLLPEISTEKAYEVMERICVALASQPVDLGGKLVQLTISSGLSCLVSKDLSLDTLMERADQALYRAKEAGRNRVVADFG